MYLPWTKIHCVQHKLCSNVGSLDNSWIQKCSGDFVPASAWQHFLAGAYVYAFCVRSSVAFGHALWFVTCCLGFFAKQWKLVAIAEQPSSSIAHRLLPFPARCWDQTIVGMHSADFGAFGAPTAKTIKFWTKHTSVVRRLVGRRAKTQNGNWCVSGANAVAAIALQA